MKLFIALAAVLALAPATGAAAADRTFETLDRNVPTWMKQARIPAVAIAVVRDGKLAGTRVYGERAPGVPADERTVFNVASLTKPAFATMTMKLVAEGQLELDAPLHEYWVDPDVADDERHLQLTPRVVLSHQTGLQNWRGGDKLAFSFAPGEKHEYSGEGFEYLRHALQRKTGQSMPALMREHVLDPAGMDASFGWNEGLAAHIATGFDEAGKPLDMRYLRQRGASAAANMFVTASDYGRFIAWVSRGAGLSASEFAEVMRPQALHDNPAEAFGLGWKLVREGGNTTALWHDGREAGVRTLAVARPGARDGIVVLSNSSNGELIMRQVVQASLVDGAGVMQQIDRDVWHYLRSLPGRQLGNILGVIVKSPSFMSMLLHAVDTNLLQASPLDPSKKRAAAESIDRFALAMLEGRIDRSQAESLVSVALQIDEGIPRLVDGFSLEQAQAWTTALNPETSAGNGSTAASKGNAPSETVRPTVEVPDRILADYAGKYLVPSSQLLITLAVKNGLLIATAPNTPATTFYPASEALFFMKESATDFRFERAESGAVSGITIIWDGKRSEFAARIP